MMETFHDLSASIPREPTVLTIGAFDGIHRGHQQLIWSVVTAARAKRLRSVLVTFFPPPAVVLARAAPFYITTNEEKLAALQSLGLDATVILGFTPELAHLRACEFVDRLIQQLDMRELWIGYDFALGARREGNATFLQALGAERGFGFHSIPPVLLEGRPISSTRIRTALRQGNIQEANACLGRPFRLTGDIVGYGRDGCRPGVHVTVAVSPEHALPATSSYTCNAWVYGEWKMYRASADIEPQSDIVAPKRTVRVYLRDREHVSGHLLTLDFLSRKQASLSSPLPQVQSIVQEV